MTSPLKIVPPPPVEPINRTYASSPLDIIRTTAQALWDKCRDAEGNVVDLEMAQAAAYMAEKALPYVHSRFAPTTPEDEDRRKHGERPVNSEMIPRDPLEASRAYQRIMRGDRGR